VLSFSEALWAEYRPRGVRILALCPGATETGFFARADEGAGGGVKKAAPEDVVREEVVAGGDAGVHPVDVDVACDVLHEEEREDHAADPGRPDPRA
jgi:NAD(P)-dependent dehydrogenase (short-subunit alcohol dehydrogenase family)